MTTTITSAKSYSTKSGEMAFQIEDSEGTLVRAVESKDRFIRVEWMCKGDWVQSHKPYKIAHSKIRNAERIKALVINFCKE
jgi:hypothetical protein